MKNRIRTALAGFAVAAALASVSACAAAPTSTYTNASGQEVTVNWRDYPLHAYRTPDEVLTAPVKEDSEEISAAILSEIKTALGREFNLEWNARGEQGWYPSSGNGYGGEAMTTTWNSVGWNSNTVPAGTAEWERIMAIISRITRAHGLGAVQVTHHGDTFKNDPEWQKDLLEEYGTADPQKLWWWDGTAHSGMQWLSVYIVDVARDPTGAAAKDYEESKLPPRSISISYGVTTVPRADRAALAKALEPFAGLTPPTPTTSD
ncbi:hypothetical protein [Arthrobacter sp. H35-D1]|uniref:hypothetical protein n=1 Tax=Arthrobacter sp. H35-D1 TaxID=3046202 RepID=UPI0024B92A03|nr:hypothetical protein [Arthrobacter sp. H35-D1]MDJ0311882.1 hypothetical protein [Arthrobacter sp. H35-D1]